MCTMVGCFVDVVQEQVMHVSSEKGGSTILAFLKREKVYFNQWIKRFITTTKVHICQISASPLSSHCSDVPRRGFFNLEGGFSKRESAYLLSELKSPDGSESLSA